MHTLSLCFGPAVWPLLFKTKEAAEAAYNLARSGLDIFTLADDFGQTLDVKSASLHGIMLEDMDQSKLAHIERALHQQRTQIQAQKTASADPSIRAAMMMGGPAMIDPMGRPANGQFGR